MRIVHQKQKTEHEAYKSWASALLSGNSSFSTAQIELLPGEVVGPRILAYDMVYYVVKGYPTIRVADEKGFVGKGAFIECPANLVHSISNNFDEEVEIRAFRVPSNERLTQFRRHFFYPMQVS